MNSQQQAEGRETKRKPRIETGCADLSGCCTLPGGIICVVLGVLLLVRWYYGSLHLREFARGDRIEMPLDLSRPGVLTWKPDFTTTSTPEDLNLCFCERYGPDLLPSLDVLDGLWLDVRVKTVTGELLAASSYRGDPTFRPIRGITLIDVIREGPVFFAEEPITVEFEVIRGVDELKGVPAALYFVNAENKYAGVPRVFDFLLARIIHDRSRNLVEGGVAVENLGFWQWLGARAHTAPFPPFDYPGCVGEITGIRALESES